MTIRRRLWLCGLLAIAGCADAANPGSATPDATETAQPHRHDAAHALTYQLAWDAKNTSSAADHQLFGVTNNLGIQFVVERGWLTSYSFEALPCEDDEPIGWLQRAWDIAVPSARAGHGELEPGVTQRRVAYVEDLAAWQTVQVAGDVTIAGFHACSLHYLLARSDDKSKQPTAVDMDRQTLHLEGQWRASAKSDWTTFLWRTNVAWGQVYALSPPADTGAGAVALTVTRRLHTLFDDIAPNTASELSAARQVLENVAADAVVTTSTP